MLRTETVSKELLNVLKELMKLKTLQNFRLVGGTALSLQLGHRKSIDIDMFSCNDFSAEEICHELIEKFKLSRLRAEGGIMIRTEINGVKVDIVDSKTPFIREIIFENGIRMASTEDIAATKIKMVCDPFSGRKTKKDLADISVLLDKYSLKQMVGFFKEKYPIMAPYEDDVIIKIKDFSGAESCEMPAMIHDISWENIKQKIEKSFKSYFDDILKEREIKLKRNKK